MKLVEIASEPIELYKLLKLEHLAATGGEAKLLITEGRVLVNGSVETQKRKKIMSGDIVEFGNEKLQIQVK